MRLEIPQNLHKLSSHVSWVIGLLLLSIVAIYFIDMMLPPDLTRFTNVSKELRTQDDQLLHVFQTSDEKWRLRASYKEVDPLYLAMLIQREDRYFYHHGGINPFAMMRAMYQWVWHGKIISGGSTLTMQVARLLEPRRRTFKAKVIEVFRALQLEERFTKQQILEIYLTLAPFGGNLEGIRAASLAYFGKSASNLTAAESALLVAIPQSPRRWQKSQFQSGTLTARNRVLSLAHRDEFLDTDTYRIAVQDPLPKTRMPLPRRMPHLARRLCMMSQAQTISYCTVQPSIQKQTEFIAFDSVKSLPPEVNMAILVVHHPSHHVVAYVGSSDFFDPGRQGQVDFVMSYRSPGSTLKPFIYGFAFEQGILQPSSYVLDDRHRFGAYLPDNFDKTFHGMVTAGEALLMSLNIPVVSLLNQLGTQRFLGILEEGGIHPRFPDAHNPPGLSLALGGVGMTLEQLVTLYAALPQGGNLTPIRKSHLEEVVDSHHFLSTTTANQLTQILLQTLTNEFGQASQEYAVKTGTSHGHRDAWAIGYNDSYVVGIWIGRPDGASFGVGTGRSLAVPVLEKVFAFLPKSTPIKTVNRPLNKKSRFAIQPAKAARHELQALHKQRPQLLFPVHDSVIEVFRSQDSLKPIMLSAMGGQRPYTWLIDGMPHARNVLHPKTSWKPTKPGFYTVSLIDAQGCCENASIEIQ